MINMENNVIIRASVWATFKKYIAYEVPIEEIKEYVDKSFGEEFSLEDNLYCFTNVKVFDLLNDESYDEFEITENEILNMEELLNNRNVRKLVSSNMLECCKNAPENANYCPICGTRLK